MRFLRVLTVVSLTFLSGLVLVRPVVAAGWVTDQVSYVQVSYGNGCVTLVNGEIAKLDLTTDVGRAEFAMALAAQNAGKPLSIYQTDGTLVGGCNVGTTIKPHTIVRMLNQ